MSPIHSHVQGNKNHVIYLPKVKIQSI